MKIASFYGFLAVMLAVFFSIGSPIVRAADHPGTVVKPPETKSEHPGTGVKPPETKAEHPGKVITSDAVKNTILEYVDAETKAHGGAFMVHDDKSKKDWRLKFIKIHDPVRQYEEGGRTIFFACSDFQSLDGTEVLDIDLWMAPEGDRLKVIDTKIHKVDGVERYHYEGTKIKPLP